MAGNYAITVTYLSDNPLSDDAEKAYIQKASKVLEKSLLKAADKLPSDHAAVLRALAERAGRMRKIKGMNQIFKDLEAFADEESINLKYRHFEVPAGPREWSPRLKGLQDIPMPENTPRPEMWDAAAIVKAVKDGFTFLVPFIFEALFEPNAYWIAGTQASATGFTVGPEHTPEIELLPDGWIKAKTYFMPEMVPDRAWLAPPNENGVVPVYVEIDPDTIDWDLLNRGHQIRVRR